MGFLLRALGIISKKEKPAPVPKSPQAGEDTSLKPGEKVNAVFTTPQGLLGDPAVGKNSLLGG